MSNDISTLTPQRLTYLQGLELGMTPARAAAFAGIANNGTGQFIKAARANPEFVAEEKRIQEMHRREISMTRTRVQNIILEAIEFAKLIGDPNAMIRGAAELNKMCGFHAPEKHVLELGERAANLRDRLEALPEDELLRLVDEEDALDVDFTEVDQEDDNNVNGAS